MLPAERNERLVRRVGFAILLLIALYIVIWLVRFVGGITHRALDQRNVPTDEGAVPFVETG
jgi:hypothetical protein